MLSKQLTHKTLIRYDENIGHLFVPGIVMRQPHSEKPYYVKTNMQSFRANFDYKEKNETGEIRIAFIGDSYTAGEGVANEMRFSDIVAHAFGAQSYNFGLSASGVDQQYLIYKDIAKKFSHDVLVISPHIINIFRNTLQSRLSVEAQTGKKVMVPKPYFTVDNGKLTRHNFPVPIERQVVNEYRGKEKLFKPNDFTRKLFHKYLPKRLKEKLLKIQFKEHRGYENESTPEWILMRTLLEGIIEEAGNIPVILAPLPYHQIFKNPDYRKRFISLAGKYSNVTFVDILEKFKEVPNTDDLDFPKDEHYSEYGHQVIAEQIIKTIKEKSILKLSPFTAPGLKAVPQKSTFILGISAFYHDSACALVKDGEIIAAAQEERFTRKKNDPGFPVYAANYCLEQAGIGIDDIKAVVFYDQPFATLERIVTTQASVYPRGKEIWQELFPKWVQTKMHIPDIISTELGYKGDVYMAMHHLSHAASAYYPSPFTSAAILTIDGVGEWATATIGVGNGNDIKILKEINFPHSAGLLYSAFTYYTGFKVNEGEYKLMGLAPYGEPTYVELIKKEIVEIFDDGSIKLNMEYFGYRDKLCMINEKFEDLFGGPARKDNEDITKRIRDIAKSIQVVTEEIVIKMAMHAKKITGAKNLCMAGGVALNCVANGKILEAKIFDEIWIQPAAGDSGGALGAALAYYHSRCNADGQKQDGISVQKSSCFGPSFSDTEIKSYLDSFGYKYRQLTPEERNKTIAGYLAQGKIAGHFAGGTEYGPRALGARSILGDPRSETTQSSLNLKIKFRESFRPFAPSVLEEDVTQFFNLHQPSPYMLIVAQVNEDRCIKNSGEYKKDLFEIVNQKRSDLPAITHVDYSARVQSVNKEMNPLYYDLINEFKKITGYGVVINTSFNVNGEPIVCTPRDAVNCFMATNMDVLVMNNFLLLKEEQQKNSDGMNIVKTRGLRLEKNKALLKAEKDASVIMYRFFPSLLPICRAAEEQLTDTKQTNWVNFSDSEYFALAKPIKNTTAEDITKNWKAISEENKKIFYPFLKSIITSSEKHKLEAKDMLTTVSDSVYVMF